MHGYPMYASWPGRPLHADELALFVCASFTSFCNVREAGARRGVGRVHRSWRRALSQTWEWVDPHDGAARTQFMAGEDVLSAEHVAAVLPNLVGVGATGALLWCFADYAEKLWDRPPLEVGGAIHERHFGLVRPDGTLKPHAEVVPRLAATDPTVEPPRRTVDLDVSADQYYADPLGHASRLYEVFLEGSVDDR